VAKYPWKELVNRYHRRFADDHRVVLNYADLCREHIFIVPTTGRLGSLTGRWLVGGLHIGSIPNHSLTTDTKHGEKY